MSAKFNNLRATAARAVADRVVPGLVVAVGQGGATVLLESFGARQLDPAPLPATADTVYDLASLSKALATSVLAMREVAAGRLLLDQRLEAVLPVCAGHPSGAATVRQLLAHASGLPAHRPFYERLLASPPNSPPAAARAALIALAAEEPLVHQTGSRSLYSDLGFILLGALLERTLGTTLDRAFAAVTSRLPGAVDLRYAPLGAPSWMAADHRPVAPTETCPWRGRAVAGEVHDPNAWTMGGVAGHAGLFGTAAAVAALVHALCAAYRGASFSAGHEPVVDREILRLFWTPSGVPASTWRLGWDGPSDTGSLAGARLARRSVGHLAFTGCSLWLDPERETFVIVLSNRVHPEVRDDERFRALRPALNDAALDDLGYRP